MNGDSADEDNSENSEEDVDWDPKKKNDLHFGGDSTTESGEESGDSTETEKVNCLFVFLIDFG